MTLSDALPAIALVLFGFTLSFLCSGLETGLYTINRVRLAVRASRRESAAITLRDAILTANRTLVILLTFNNVANYTISYGIASLLHRTGMRDWTLIAVEAVVFTPLLFIACEMLPKDLFRTHTDRWSYALAPIISFMRWTLTVTLLLPLVEGLSKLIGRLFNVSGPGAATARQRISLLIQEGAGAGVLSHAQTTLAERALAVRDRRVTDVCVAWRNVERLRIDESYDSRTRSLRLHGHSRVPVIDAGGRIVGVVSWLEAALEREKSLPEIMTSPLTFPPHTTVLAALSTMRQERCAIAFVIQPSGAPLGLLTLKDLVEPLTGKLAAW